jgi:hypothetical protein
MYENRVLAAKHVRCQRELRSLEHDVRRGKVNHPPKGSKDLSDALAGVVLGLSTRREAIAEHGLGDCPHQLQLIQPAEHLFVDALRLVEHCPM